MSKTVVIIDDSSFLINQVAAFFNNELQFNVVATGKDGNDAVRLYREHKPDLITLDLTMPNKSGIEAIDEILNEFPEANILVISAVRGDTILQCMSKGAKGYIEKPLKFKDPDFIADFKETIKEAVGP